MTYKQKHDYSGHELYVNYKQAFGSLLVHETKTKISST